MNERNIFFQAYKKEGVGASFCWTVELCGVF